MDDSESTSLEQIRAFPGGSGGVRLPGRAELVVSGERVVRDRLPSDPPCTGMIIFDLEGELFFGAAPELDGYFAVLEKRALDEGIRCIVLRLKHTSNRIWSAWSASTTSSRTWSGMASLCFSAECVKNSRAS